MPQAPRNQGTRGGCTGAPRRLYSGHFPVILDDVEWLRPDGRAERRGDLAMATAPLMPKATAVWLVENTSPSFEQLAQLCILHPLAGHAIPDGDAAQRIQRPAPNP